METKELTTYEKELLTEVINVYIDKIDSGTISYGSEADNEEYKKVLYRILDKMSN